VAALAILMPPNAFPGAATLDWIGLTVSITVLVLNYLRSRTVRSRQPASA
jgi:hypothetical protein